MNIATLLLFFVGDHDAILRFASDRWTLLLGAILVLSAGLARNYSRVDLRRKPWFLAIPFAASIATSFGLFAWIVAVAWWQGSTLKMSFEHYLSLLGLYWLTAPLACLYGLPVERWLSRVDAVRCRLTILGVVATWRVALITRVLYVLLTANGIGLWCAVMVYVSTLAIVAIVVTSWRQEKPEPAPAVISFMGAMPPPQRQERHIIGRVGCFVSIGASILIIACGYQLVSSQAIATSWQFYEDPFANPVGPRIDLWLLAATSVIGWLFVLPGADRRHRLAKRVDELNKAGDFDQAVTLMIDSGPKGFPAGWLPPPNRFGQPDHGVEFLAGIDIILRSDPNKWLLNHCREQLDEFCRDARWYWETNRLAQLTNILKRLPDSSSIANVACQSLTELEDYHELVRTFRQEVEDELTDENPQEFDFLNPKVEVLDPDPEMTEERQSTLNQLRELAGVSKLFESDDSE